MLQATLPLNPARIIGIPATETPAAWYLGARICTGLHSPGMPSGPWLSLASRLCRCGCVVARWPSCSKTQRSKVQLGQLAGGLADLVQARNLAVEPQALEFVGLGHGRGSSG